MDVPDIMYSDNNDGYLMYPNVVQEEQVYTYDTNEYDLIQTEYTQEYTEEYPEDNTNNEYVQDYTGEYTSEYTEYPENYTQEYTEAYTQEDYVNMVDINPKDIYAKYEDDEYDYINEEDLNETELERIIINLKKLELIIFIDDRYPNKGVKTLLDPDFHGLLPYSNIFHIVIFTYDVNYRIKRWSDCSYITIVEIPKVEPRISLESVMLSKASNILANTEKRYIYTLITKDDDLVNSLYTFYSSKNIQLNVIDPNKHLAYYIYRLLGLDQQDIYNRSQFVRDLKSNKPSNRKIAHFIKCEGITFSMPEKSIHDMLEDLHVIGITCRYSPIACKLVKDKVKDMVGVLRMNNDKIVNNASNQDKMFNEINKVRSYDRRNDTRTNPIIISSKVTTSSNGTTSHTITTTIVPNSSPTKCIACMQSAHEHMKYEFCCHTYLDKVSRTLNTMPSNAAFPIYYVTDKVPIPALITRNIPNFKTRLFNCDLSKSLKIKYDSFRNTIRLQV